MQKVLVVHSEIALKGKNRKEYESKLKGSITRAAKLNNLTIISFKNHASQFMYEFDNSQEEIISVLSKVFGIKYFSFISQIEKNMDTLKEYISLELDELKAQGIKEIAFDTSRNDKDFEESSPQINSKLGEIVTQKGLSINYRQKEIVFRIKVLQTNHILIYRKRYEGLAGLPSGSTGKMLVLLSGGIDSPVAAFKMMSRGIVCDFLHVHDLKSSQEVEESKIKRIIEQLNSFQLKKSKLYTLPHFIFYIHTKSKMYDNYTTVFFKKYLLEIAEKICKENEYLGIITGDSLAQVASQTPENIALCSQNISIPIYRPFIGSDKEEIISLSQKAGLFELSIEKYKDCCAITSSPNPVLKAKSEKFEKAIQYVDIEKLMDESFKNIEEFLF